MVVGADHLRHAAVELAHRADRGLGIGAVHLYTLLKTRLHE